jgi:uncharacterized protein (DUF2062 family)
MQIDRDKMKRHYLKFVRRFYKMLRDPRVQKNRFFSSIAHRITNRRLWKPCRYTVSHGLAIGMFFAMMLPLPFQGFFAAYFAIRSRANVPFAMAAVWISNPTTVVPLAWMQEKLGSFIHKLGLPRLPFLDISQDVPFTDMNCNVSNLVVGMVMSGVICSILSYPLVHICSLILPQHLPAKRKERRQDIMRKQ